MNRISLLLHVCTSGIPNPPSTFNFEVDPNDSWSINVTWTESVQTGPIDEVDEYVVEKRINMRDFQLVRIQYYVHEINVIMHRITYHTSFKDLAKKKKFFVRGSPKLILIVEVKFPHCSPERQRAEQLEVEATPPISQGRLMRL